VVTVLIALSIGRLLMRFTSIALAMTAQDGLGTNAFRLIPN
jgi:hypothetical protein